MSMNWSDLSLPDLAGIISKAASKAGIEVILVGGACVTFYS